MKPGWIYVGLLILILLSACSSGDIPSIEVIAPWARAVTMGGGENQDGSMAGTNGAAYMVLENHTNAPDRLLYANADVADAVELHLSQMVDGVMKMQPQEAIDIPAKGQLELKPGSYHIMLIGLQQDLAVGESFLLTLEFETAGLVTVEVEIREP